MQGPYYHPGEKRRLLPFLLPTRELSSFWGGHLRPPVVGRHSCPPLNASTSPEKGYCHRLGREAVFFGVIRGIDIPPLILLGMAAARVQILRAAVIPDIMILPSLALFFPPNFSLSHSLSLVSAYFRIPMPFFPPSPLAVPFTILSSPDTSAFSNLSLLTTSNASPPTSPFPLSLLPSPYLYTIAQHRPHQSVK